MNFKKDLADIYNNIINIEEDIELYENDENKFTIADYTKLINEGQSGHGDVKAVRELIQQGVNNGLIKDVKETKAGWILKSAVDSSMETIHRGEKNLHYIRRYLNNLASLKKA